MLCLICKKRLIAIKKRGICLACYQGMKRAGLMKNVPGLRTSLYIEKLRIIKKYGIEFINDLYALKERPFWNLTEMGKKYDLSRERIRQIFKLFTKEPYRKYQKMKTKKIMQDIFSMGNGCDPRHRLDLGKKYSTMNQGQVYAIERAKQFGLELRAHFIKENRRYRYFIANGYKIKIRTSSSLVFTNSYDKTGCHHFKTSSKDFKYCDFFIFVCIDNNLGKFFIVPKLAMDKSEIYISASIKNHWLAKNKFYEYEDRWNLLK